MRRPQITPWLVICCLAAVPIVLSIEQDVYEVVSVFLSAGVWVCTHAAVAVGQGIMHAVNPGPCLGVGQCLGHLVWLLTGGLVGLIIAVAVMFLVFLAGLPFMLVAGALSWLATHAGPPRLVFEAGMMWYVGLFLYGTVFPLLWRVTEPIIAHTLAEAAFQRAKLRVYGERPRYRQPLYLTVAVLTFGAVALRLSLPAGATVASALSSSVHDVTDPVFRPPARRPPSPSRAEVESR